MREIVTSAVLVFVSFVQTPTPPTPQRGAPPPAQGVQRKAPPKPPVRLTLRQVVEGLSTLKSTARVEDQISKAGGVQFEATPAVVDLLLQLGAGQKLIAMIPVPPPAPEPPARKTAGPLTIVCEPKDCAVAVDQQYGGPTTQSRKTITGLTPGEVTVEVFADGFEHATRRIKLEENQPKEEKFALKRSAVIRQQSASGSMLRAVTSLGGTDGLAELADFEGSGTMQWTNSNGQNEQWSMTFNKRVGRDLAVTFKTKDGQCTASIVAAATKQECKNSLKNGGDKIAEQGSSLFLSYQPSDVLNALLKRNLLTSETDDNRLESVDVKDSYVLTIDTDGLPKELLYRIGEDPAIQIQYSNYLTLNNARYPGRIAIGRVNTTPVWVFTFSSIRSRVGRPQ